MVNDNNHEEVSFDKKAFEFLSYKAKTDKVTEPVMEIINTLDTPKSFISSMCALIDTWCLKYKYSPRQIAKAISKICGSPDNPLNELCDFLDSLSPDDVAELLQILEDSEDTNE